MDLETTILAPNEAMIQSVKIFQRIINGEKVIGCKVTYQGVKVTDKDLPSESWQETLHFRAFAVDDLKNLPAELSHLQAGVNGLLADINTFVAAVNDVEKVI